MPQVLTTNARIFCPHGGAGTSIPTSPKWSVNSGVVLLENDPGTLACPFGLYPCVGYQLRSMGFNATQVDGRRVILVTDFNQSFTGLPLTFTELHQTFDDSTLNPIPPGQGAPSLSPVLADAIKPVVTGIPPALAFNSATMVPPTLTATFTLAHDYPSQWILTLLNTAQRRDLNVTNGDPAAGLIVTPPGGNWNTPNLTVSISMSSLYMAGLGIGTHHFFMTGVNQRGLSAFAEIILTVT